MTYDEWVDDCLGLFPAENSLTPPPAPSGIFGALGTKWTAHKGAHKPCDACVELIHAMGAATAPYPQAASWRRRGPNGDRFLCNAHGEQHRRLDETVTAEHAERAAFAEHQAKARRS